MTHETHDFVVIGGGSAGCIAATRLALAGADVLLLEAGPPDKGIDFKIPANVGKVYMGANWKYPCEPDASRNNLAEPWPAGKVLGGGGSINSMVFIRGHRADYDGWAKLGASGWEYESVLPSFKRMESWKGGADPYRGGTGPIHVTEQTYKHVGNDAFLEAAQQAGHTFTNDYNGAQPEGVGKTQTNQKRGFRSHSAQGYVRGLDPPTLEVRFESYVLRLLFEGDKAVGAEYRHQGRTKQVRSRQEVILSAGSVISPKLLMLSGIGPRKHLEDHGIEVVHTSPGVGQNLQDHPSLMMRWHSTVPTLNRPTPAVKLKAGIDFIRNGSGPLAMTYYHVLVLHKTESSLEKPNIQIGFSPLAISRDMDEHGMLAVAPSPDCGFLVTVHLVSPRHRGQITLRSNRPDDMPLIQHQYLANPEDFVDLLAGGAEGRRIMSQSAMTELISTPFEPEVDCRTEKDWREQARTHTTFSAHPVGTCKMGVDDISVVDPQLRVHGVRNLRVIDASIMPTTTTGNTNAPSMMIGERGAELVLGD